MKLLIVADIHIKLGQRKVPKDWAKARVMQLAEEINKLQPEGVVIAGDLLDVAKPSVEEVALMLDFLKEITVPKVLIPGNHEMVTKKRDCYEPLDAILTEYCNTGVIREFGSFDAIPNIDFIPYNVIKDDFPKTGNKYAITHVRGEIPPHVEPEVDLSKFAQYEKVFAGDLHSFQNSQLNLLYPGSPYTTSFHRNPSNKGTTGVFLFDSETGEHEWIQLDLPEMLRYTVSSPEEMLPDDRHCVIYELEGELEDLSKVKDSDLLDKKIANDVVTDAQLDFSETELEEEVEIYLRDVKQMEETKIKRAVTTLREVRK